MHLRLCVYIFLADLFIQSVLLRILIKPDWRQSQLHIKEKSMVFNQNISVLVWIISK